MQEVQGISGLGLQALYSQILLLFVCSLRVGAFLVASPFFGSRMIPLQIRIVFSVVLALAVLMVADLPDTSMFFSGKLIIIIVMEIFIGISAGMVLTICFGAVQLAGEKIAATSGLSFASQLDPANGSQSPVISQIFSLFLLVLFFSANGHLFIFKTLYKSFEIFPLGVTGRSQHFVQTTLDASGIVYEKAAIIALPIVAVLFFMNVGIGFITKSAPQLNLFSFGFPMTILGTFLTLYFSVDALQYAFNDLLDTALSVVDKLLLGVGDG